MQYLEQTSMASYISVSLTQSKLDVQFATYRGRYVTGGEDVIFTVVIIGGFAPYTYEWDFGDGDTSTEDLPVHAYSSAGEYTVSLTVTDDRGNTDIEMRADYIHVQSGWSTGNIARSAWDGLRIFGQVLVDIFIWVGTFSPILIVAGVVIYLIRRRIRRRKAVD
jgi:PKD repeat protein